MGLCSKTEPVETNHDFHFRLLLLGVKCPCDVPIESPQHTDARMHQRSTIFCGHDQRLDCGLPRFQDLIRPSEALRCSRRHRAESTSTSLRPSGSKTGIIEGTSPGGQRASIVRSAIRLQGCAERSIRPLFPAASGCCDGRADSCAFP